MSGDAEPCSFDVNDESGWFHEQTELPFWGPMALRLLKVCSFFLFSIHF